MAEWKELGNKAKNLTLAGLGKARDLGQSAKLNLDNVSEQKTDLRGDRKTVRVRARHSAGGI